MITLITLSYTFPIRLFVTLLNDCLLIEKKGEKNDLPKFFPSWDITVILGLLNLEKKKCISS